MDYKFALTWEQADIYEQDWNRLWKVTPVCRDEYYAYRWMKMISAHKGGSAGKPFFMILKDAPESAAVILPLYRRQRSYTRLGIKLNSLSFLPNETILRHHFMLGHCGQAFDWPLFKKALFEKLGKEKVHVAELKGMTMASTKELAAASQKLGLKYTVHRSQALPGVQASDLLAVEAPENWDVYFESLRRRMKRLIKRSPERAAELGKWEVWRMTANITHGEPKPIPAIVEAINAIEKNCWQQKIGRVFGRYVIAHQVELMTMLYEQKVEDVAILYINGQPVSYYLGAVVNGHGTAFFTAFDENFGHVSPGTLLYSELIKGSHSRGIARINLTGAPPGEYKHEFAGIKDMTYTVFVYTNSLKGRLFYLAQKYITRKTLDLGKTV